MNHISASIESLPDREDSCEKHGVFTSRNFLGRVWSRCPVCAQEEADRRKQEEEQEARRRRKEAWQTQIGEAGIPERFQDRTLDNYDAQTPEQVKALTFAREYAENFDQALKTGRCALFIGKPGTGKTHLAVGIGLRIMGRDHRIVLFSTVMRAIRRVKDSWSKTTDETESQAIRALTRPDLLILDEVGIQFGSDTEKLILFDVLNERYEKRRPTIMLSNLDTEELKGYLGERIFDRIREDKGAVIRFTWESHRRAA